MKTIHTFFLLLLLGLAAILPAGYAQTCNCSTFVSGDTIRVQAADNKCLSGNTNAVVIVSGGNLCIPPGDTLTMKRAFLTGGKITNNGVINYDTTSTNIAIDSARITNNGTININIYSETNWNGGYLGALGKVVVNTRKIRIQNATNAGIFTVTADTINLNGNFGSSFFNAGTTVLNGSTFMFNTSFGMIGGSGSVDNYPGASFTINGNLRTIYEFRVSSIIRNRGTFRVNGGVNFEQRAVVFNYGQFYTTGHVNNAGEITNNGLFSVPTIGFNAALCYLTNNCKFLVADSFYTSKRTYNNGLIQVTNPNGILYIAAGASFRNTVKGKTMGDRFTNSGVVSGGGDFYFTGETRQAGTFAGSYNNIDSFLNFYDVNNTPAIPGSFFDFGIQGARVKRVAFTAPDTATYACNLVDTVFTPLPVTLYSFTAEAAGSQVALRWLTGEEKNVRTFEIERSATGTGWKMIGAVAAANAPGQHNYAFTDITPANGLNLYRLKSVDIDGKYTYSETRAVSFGAGGSGEAAAYPNPATNKLNLVYYDAQQESNLSYSLYDLNGRVLLHGNWNITAGANTREIDVTALPAGILLLKVTDKRGAVVLQQKVIKK